MFDAPERLPHEVFLGNMTRGCAETCAFATKRRGSVAYMRDGTAS